MRRVRLLVLGQVQGVSFRAESQRKAKEFSLAGWVRNLPDGRVEITAEGEKENIEKFIEWIKQSPALSKVSNIKSEWQDYIGEFNNFNIK